MRFRSIFLCLSALCHLISTGAHSFSQINLFSCCFLGPKVHALVARTFVVHHFSILPFCSQIKSAPGFLVRARSGVNLYEHLKRKDYMPFMWVYGRCTLFERSLTDSGA